MVCAKCEKKLAKLETPDKWKDGARNTNASDKRKIGANKLLKGKKNRFNPYEQFHKCKICKVKVHQKHAHYCQGCAYKIGICAMCGKQMIDTKDLKQTN
ncbi:cysteine-rich PDZ-binding protein [Salpingoeca rosetta]|uniref:Cysteine-rich PDZ-binding protein n=1 Tax=Salpingoeca rosetta (strain ATCC 50818 / BSB-021) TaxID=946362 RepID=F2U2D0_SALR5|nr:cysteine-rich PDZ-binding protein [Salpingoeca rosetta]EGD81782.1 cysteine-rich PDZ-binding protein [Salpingoeca rosetta]|eukprot:XP_004996986.1 cysteine-rich PDZ-binding protein [Salpingoeca rosetta]